MRFLATVVLFSSLLSACELPGIPGWDGGIQPQPNQCIVTGCSGEICASEGMASDCAWRPEYACYKLVKCEKQASGQCGWTETADFKSCMANPPNN